MANAVIGALRVSLGLDSAKFNTGLDKAETRTQRFSRRMTLAFTGIAVAGAAMTAAITAGVRSTLKSADEMTKLAQSIGVPVEELSRLAHAADLSGVGMDGLAKGVGRLSRAMTDIASGSGLETKKAFDALGISVMNSDGTLKSSTEVMQEVAGRFAAMQDGAAKTGLAMTIFGKSGAALIPMLNSGADGLSRMMAEADALGIVLDKNTGQAAEAFNDNMTRLGKVWDGMVLKISAAMLPTLEKLSDTFVFVASDTDIMKGAAEFLSDALKGLVATGTWAVAVFKSLGATWRGVYEVFELTFGGEFAKARQRFRDMVSEIDAIETKAREVVSKIWDDSPSQAQINRRIANAFGDAGTAAGQKFVANFAQTSTKALDKMAKEALAGLQDLADWTNQTVADTQAALGYAADYISSRFDDFFSGLEQGKSAWESFRDVGLGVIKDLARAFLRSSILKFVLGMFGGGQAALSSGIPMFSASDFNSAGVLASAKGNVFAGAAGLSAFSNSIVRRPTMFAFANGAGLMGEAGPEAVMPLTRGRDGKLGVQANGGGGGGSVDVNVSVSVDDDGKIQAYVKKQRAESEAGSYGRHVQNHIKARQSRAIR